MLTQAEFKSLIDKIVRSDLPSEESTYEAFRDELIETVYSERDVREAKGEAGQFEFGESVIIGMQVFTLIWGTYKALKELYKEVRQFGGETSEGIASIWSARLVEAGLNVALAEKIANGFAAEARKLIQP